MSFYLSNRQLTWYGWNAVTHGYHVSNESGRSYGVRTPFLGLALGKNWYEPDTDRRSNHPVIRFLPKIPLRWSWNVHGEPRE